MEPRHTATSEPDDPRAAAPDAGADSSAPDFPPTIELIDSTGSTKPSGRRSRHPFTIMLFGEVDIARGEELATLVDDFRHSGSRDVDVDLTAVEFLDSTGLSAVSRLRDIAADRGGTVRLLSPRPAVRRVLEVSGVTNLCEIID
jgi:anti-anti-sigma factor